MFYLGANGSNHQLCTAQKMNRPLIYMLQRHKFWPGLEDVCNEVRMGKFGDVIRKVNIGIIPPYSSVAFEARVSPIPAAGQVP